MELANDRNHPASLGSQSRSPRHDACRFVGTVVCKDTKGRVMARRPAGAVVCRGVLCQWRLGMAFGSVGVELAIPNDIGSRREFRKVRTRNRAQRRKYSG